MPSFESLASTTPSPTGLHILEASAASSPACTVSIEGATTPIVRRGRLLSVEGVVVRIALRADAIETTTQLTHDVPATVCVRANQQDLVFFSRVIVPPPASGPEASATELANGEVEIALSLPGEVIATRRRTSVRVAVAQTDAIELRIWRLDAHAILRDQPPPSRGLRCALCDLSANGLRAIVWPRRIEALQLAEDQRFRIELKWEEVPLIFEARLRHPRATARDDELAVCGFELLHQEDRIESRRARQKLDALLAKLQRSAARRDAA